MLTGGNELDTKNETRNHGQSGRPPGTDHFPTIYRQILRCNGCEARRHRPFRVACFRFWFVVVLTYKNQLAMRISTHLTIILCYHGTLPARTVQPNIRSGLP